MKLTSFSLFCERMRELGRSSIDFKAEEIRRDVDRQHYNAMLVAVMDEVVLRTPQLQSHPAFDPLSSAYLQRLF